MYKIRSFRCNKNEFMIICLRCKQRARTINIRQFSNRFLSDSYYLSDYNHNINIYHYNLIGIKKLRILCIGDMKMVQHERIPLVFLNLRYGIKKIKVL